jgi:hypothetical protein
VLYFTWPECCNASLRSQQLTQGRNKVAHKLALWSRSGAISNSLGVIAALTVMCSTIAQANSGEAFQAGLRVIIPFADGTMKTDDTRIFMEARKASSRYDKKNRPETSRIAFLSFINDGYFKKIKVDQYNVSDKSNVATPLRSVAHREIRPVAARRVNGVRTRRSFERYCALNGFPANARRASSKKLHIQANYCRALQKHKAMLLSYQRYKRLYVKAKPMDAMPELAGGPKVRSYTKRSKNAYFDYLVARKAYQKALGDYHTALRPPRRGQRRRAR